jgi:hypothetical protein
MQQNMCSVAFNEGGHARLKDLQLVAGRSSFAKFIG